MSGRRLRDRRRRGGRAAPADQRAELRALQDVRHQGPGRRTSTGSCRRAAADRTIRADVTARAGNGFTNRHHVHGSQRVRAASVAPCLRCASRSALLLGMRGGRPRAAGRAPMPDDAPPRSYGAFLAGRIAHAARRTCQPAARDSWHALRRRSGDPELHAASAFLASLMRGRPEAAQLARALPDSRGGAAAAGLRRARPAGDWPAARAALRELPPRGRDRAVRPLLLAWAQQGGGDARRGAARRCIRRSTRPALPRRLHAARGLIADHAGRPTMARKSRQAAIGEPATLNLRLAQILAMARCTRASRQRRSAPCERSPPSATKCALAARDRCARRRPQPPPVTARRKTASPRRISRSRQRARAVPDDFARAAAAPRARAAAGFSAAQLLLADDDELRTARAEPRGARTHSDQRRSRRWWCCGARCCVTRVGSTEEAIAELKQMAADASRPGGAATWQLGDLLRAASSASPRRSTPMTRRIALRPKPATAAWNMLFSRRRRATNARQLGAGGGRPAAGARARAGAADGAELSRLFLGRRGKNLKAARGDDREGADAAAEGRPHRGQPGLGDAPPGRRRRRGEHAGEAVELAPEDATINGHLGDAYWAAGAKLEARYQWRRALALQPEPRDAASREPSCGRIRRRRLRPRVAAGAAAAPRGPVRCAERGAGRRGVAPAKVNLYLHVTGRRADGYHLLDSLAVFAAVGDRLAAAPADVLSLAVTGPFAAGAGGGADNLVLRAARALAAAAGVRGRGAR